MGRPTRVASAGSNVCHEVGVAGERDGDGLASKRPRTTVSMHNTKRAHAVTSAVSQPVDVTTLSTAAAAGLTAASSSAVCGTDAATAASCGSATESVWWMAPAKNAAQSATNVKRTRIRLIRPPTRSLPSAEFVLIGAMVTSRPCKRAEASMHRQSSRMTWLPSRQRPYCGLLVKGTP